MTKKMVLLIKNIFQISKTAFRKWWAKDPFKESAVIAYYAIFSLPGLLLVMVSIVGYFFGQEAVNGEIALQITSSLGVDTALQIQDIIAKSTISKNSTVATIVGVITMLLGATGVFAEFQKSINIIWEVKADEFESNFVGLIKARLFSFGIIIAISFILVASLVISALLSAIGSWVTLHFSDSLLIVLQFVNFLFSLSILTGLFALMFKFFPDAKIEWPHIWIGAFVTSVLFEFGKLGMGFYFGTANPGSIYGTTGSIILILLWASYSSMIVFYGAEFTHAYADFMNRNSRDIEIGSEDDCKTK